MGQQTTNTGSNQRLESFSIRTEQQWLALTSAVRFELMTYLVACGPCSIAELAKQMDTRADGLYHHVRKLQAAGLVVENGFRRAGRQIEVIYDVVAEKLVFEGIGADPNKQSLVSKLLRSVNRRCERQFEDALENGLISFSDENRTAYIRGDTTWLNQQELKRVQEHVDAILQIFAKGRQRRNGDLYALTLNFCPLVRERRKDE